MTGRQLQVRVAKQARKSEPARLPRRGEEGFTIVEVLMASVVILIAMAALGFVATRSLAQVSFAKQRQGANDLLDKTLEQVRALTFDTVQLGLDPSNDPTWSSDPVTASGSYGGQTILVADRAHGYSQVPLVPHQQTLAPIGGNDYTIDVYPTNPPGADSFRVVEVSVVVSWANPEIRGVANSVTGQTLVYSPGVGCLAGADHLFAAPCQPFYYATATGGRGIVSVSAAAGNTSPLGSLLKTAELLAPTASVETEVEQTSSVATSATTSGAVIDTGSGPTTYGDQAVNSFADNDPGTADAAYQSSSVAPAPSGGATVTAADGSTFTLATSSSDTASATSASAASTSQICNDLSGAAVVTGLPCGDASGKDVSGVSSANMTLPVGPSTLAASLVSMTDAVSAFGAQGQGATFCTAAPVAGCIHAGVSRTNESLDVGGLPTVGGISLYPLTGSLLGWNGSFLEVAGSDQVAAESGTSPTSPSATSGLSVKVFSGGLYVPLTSGMSLPSLSLPAVILGTETVAMTITLANLSFGSAHTTTGAGCPTSCLATSSSPVSGDLIYTITVDNPATNTINNLSLDVHIDLGTISAQTTYQPAPTS